MTHLLISVHEVHDSIVVVVVVHILGCIHRQHQVVGSQPIPLGISVAEDTCLQHLVITVPNTCSTNTNKLWITHGLLAQNYMQSEELVFNIVRPGITRLCRRHKSWPQQLLLIL